MTNGLKKAIHVLVLVLIAFMILVGLQKALLTDDVAKELLSAVFEQLPFAQVIVEGVVNVLHYQHTIENLMPRGILEDLIRLLIMCIIQPLFTSLVMAIFLPMPSGMNSFQMDEYQNRPSYRIKELLINVLTVPVVALLAGFLITWIGNALVARIGAIATTVVGIVAVIGLGVLSVPTLMSAAAIGIGVAIQFRLIYTILEKVVKTLGFEFLCVIIALAFLNDCQGVGLIMIVITLLYLIAFDLLIQSVSSSLHWK